MGRTGTHHRSQNIPTPQPRGLIGQFALGQYELLKLIGEGSNGEVYLARPRTQPNQYVVVKRVKPHVLQNPKFVQFFESEVTSMQRFKHPYAVQLFDVALHDPIGPCMVLEYIHGVTLEALMQKYPRWFPDRMLRLLAILGHALQAAHDMGIMHRDLKPANLMVTDFNTPNESLKVMDFGFAGFADQTFIQLSEITGEGPVFACGTPAYVSPEMVRGDTVDHRADLYSVGVMMYEMLAGRLPFDYPKVSEILDGHRVQQPPRFHKLGIKDIPPAVENVVQVALSKYPNERHNTARELVTHFAHAMGRTIWDETAPVGYTRPSSKTTIRIATNSTVASAPEPGSLEDQFTLSDQFEALLPPKLAAMKLRSFVDEVEGTVLDSQPGLITMRIGLAANWTPTPTRSGVMGWLDSVRRPSYRSGQEPIEVQLRMTNVDANRVAVRVSFHPIKQFMPDSLPVWQNRCEELYQLLRSFLMAQ
jgi:eukaryotic-like serine/threonine-protein kinase